MPKPSLSSWPRQRSWARATTGPGIEQTDRHRHTQGVINEGEGQVLAHIANGNCRFFVQTPQWVVHLGNQCVFLAGAFALTGVAFLPGEILGR